MSTETGQGINSSKCVNGSAPTHLFLLLEKLYRIKRIVKDINMHMSFTYVKPRHFTPVQMRESGWAGWADHQPSRSAAGW